MSELPESTHILEPQRVWVNSGNVTLRFSGGHSQYVHIEYYGDRSPPELELITESIFSEVDAERFAVGRQRVDRRAVDARRGAPKKQVVLRP